MKVAARNLIVLGIAAVLLSACAQPQQPDLISSQKSPVELRAMQSRMFETGDRMKVLRATISAFQDLGYAIEKVEPATGTITADKLAFLRMTATVFPRDKDRMIVRANAIVRMGSQNQRYQVDDPEFYQKDFFEPVSKALFLTALLVEDVDEAGPEADKAAKGAGEKDQQK